MIRHIDYRKLFINPWGHIKLYHHDYHYQHFSVFNSFQYSDNYRIYDIIQLMLDSLLYCLVTSTHLKPELKPTCLKQHSPIDKYVYKSSLLLASVSTGVAKFRFTYRTCALIHWSIFTNSPAPDTHVHTETLALEKLHTLKFRLIHLQVVFIINCYSTASHTRRKAIVHSYKFNYKCEIYMITNKCI